MSILNKITLKYLKLNKKRTIVSIIGVVLSTALMVGVGLLFSTVRDNMIKSVISNKGDYIFELKNFPSNKLNELKNNNELESNMIIEQGIASALFESSTNEYKPYLYLISGNDEYLKSLKLVEGRLPENSNEIVISQHLIYNGGAKYNVGDIISYEFGDRYYVDDYEVIGNASYSSDEPEELRNTKAMDLKIVGIVERSNYELYSAAGYSIFTKRSFDDKPVNVYAKYKNVNNVYDRTEKLVSSYGLSINDIEYNSSLLSLYGQTRYGNYNNSLIMIMSIFLGLISIACIIVIYNSFAISISERKKQFGLLSSIGATKRQIIRSVYFEAFIIGVVGITVGIISSIFGIGVLLRVINSLLKGVFEFELSLSFYPEFIIIPIIFMMVTIFFSALIPAIRASRITPIEAIRQNDDIKLKSKKLKTNKLVKKLFGVEGELAMKNMKRNKKKYRITIVSLFISIVLFISFSCFLKYSFSSIDDLTLLPDYDVYIYNNSNEDSLSKYEILSKTNKVDDSLIVKKVNNYRIKIDDKYLSDSFKSFLIEDSKIYQNLVEVVISDSDYKKIVKKYSLDINKPIIIDNYKAVEYDKNSKKNYSGKIFNDNFDKKILLCDFEFTSEINCMEPNSVNLIQEIPFGISSYISGYNIVMITNDSLSKEYNSLKSEGYEYSCLYIKSSDETYLKKAFDDICDTNYEYYSVKEEMKLVNNLVLVIKILLYGFISLVTLIGVTSVFNTINTNILLRRREFAMLRSIGLQPKGFNKILFLESLFFGFKSLIYSLPVSFAIMYLIRFAISDVYSYDHLLVPWGSVLIAIIAVFLIVLMTMLYSSRKIKKENILESIKDENI